MTLVLIDGFEDLGSWSIAGGSLGTGRNGNAFNTGSSAGASYGIPTSLQTNSLTVGVAFKMTQYNGFNPMVLDLRSDTGTTSHVTLALANTQLALNTGGTNRYNSPGGSIALNTWYYVELQTVLSDTGSVTLRLNGTTLYTNGSVDTKNAGTKTVFDYILMYGNTNALVYWDDFYATNSIDTFWGDIAVETLYPDGMDTTAWVGSDGDAVNNHLLVNEAGTPVDTTYVQSSTVAAREVYTCQNLLRTTGTIPAVMVTARANKSDSGARGLKVVAKEGVVPGAPQSFFAGGGNSSSSTGAGSQSFGSEYVIAVAGRITGLRFQNADGSNLGPHTLRLYSTAGGTLLGTCATAGEVNGQKSSAYFATPIEVAAGTTVRTQVNYVTNEVWSRTNQAVPSVNANITLTNGVWGSISSYPNNIDASWRYLVDPIFEAYVPPVIRSTADTALTTTFTDYPLPLEKKGGPVSSVYTTQTPSGSGNDATNIWIGAKFTTTTAGTITGLRFYRFATGQTLTSRQLVLWTEAGVQVASGTTTGESGAGWFSATLTTPYPIAAGASVRAAFQHTGGTFAFNTGTISPVTNGPLTRDAPYFSNTSVSPLFPTNAGATGDYFMDVIFQADGTAWTVADVNALGIGVEVSS